MTNGEKLQQTFKVYVREVGEGMTRFYIAGIMYLTNTDWWNAEYKEPVSRYNEIKNDLNRVEDELEPTTKNEAKYCDRNICLKNEYNNIGCENCEVTKSQESTTKNDSTVDCISREQAVKTIQRYGVGCFDADEFSPEECERFVIAKLNRLPSVTLQICEDAISRQALLNATVKKSSIWNYITNSEGDNLEAIVSKLPSVSSQELTTKKDCNTCTHSNETDGSNCYECVKDMCNNYEPTYKNDLAVDCISRSDVLQTLLDYDYANENALVIKDIKALPSVTPQEPRWISVSEKLPNDRDWYLGIFKEPDTGWINPLPFICDYVGHETKATTKEHWILRGFTNIDKPCDYYLNLECVAWMPLPQPYREVKE